LAKELAEFVEGSVRDLLMLRGDFDPETTEEISEVFRRRLDFANENEDGEEPVEVRLSRAIKDGALDEQKLNDALGMRDYEFVTGALAYMTKAKFLTVQKIIDMQAPKALIALSWKAGLSARFALQLQKTVGRIQPKEMIYPKDGSDYALSKEEIDWQLDFLGLHRK
jgi:hypothetical protein